MITKNYGRDIAKFYYGNYALTEAQKTSKNGEKQAPHTHSAQANDILNSMIVGFLDDQEEVAYVDTKIFCKRDLTKDIASFTFKQIDGT